MPRVNPQRSLVNEQNLARRIAFERETNGWSYEGLARRMGAAGYPIQASAIFKIEKGKPPRRVTVDELVGFAEVFRKDPANLLVAVDLLRHRKLLDLYNKRKKIVAQLDDVIAKLGESESELARYLTADPEARAVLLRNVRLAAERMDERLGKFTFDDMEAASAAVAQWPGQVENARSSLLKAIHEGAGADENV